jgi:phospholipase C
MTLRVYVRMIGGLILSLLLLAQSLGRGYIALKYQRAIELLVWGRVGMDPGRSRRFKLQAVSAFGKLSAVVLAVAVLSAVGVRARADQPRGRDGPVQPATPIWHLVVIYDENVSFDHYFGTYPEAENPQGEPRFAAAPGTPTVDNLRTAGLLTNNPNATNPRNDGRYLPFRLDRSQAATADQDHQYTAEQEAEDGGKADLFPLFTGNGTPGGAGAFGTRGLVMGYYDGNTVTALWNYAQHFAMSDHAYTNTYGPSTPGALEVVSGQTNGVELVKSSENYYYIPDGQGGLTLIDDVDPAFDKCSTGDEVMMLGKNIGDLLDASRVSWGGFMGGFDLDVKNKNGTTGCKRSTFSTVVNGPKADYVPHHNWFQYFASTSNPDHLLPSSIAAVGHTYDANGKRDPANHEYGMAEFWKAVEAGYLPAVSFLKAPASEDGHAGYSDPLDEQAWIVDVVNRLEKRPEWSHTAIIITWDDSDGWYDHAFIPSARSSRDPSGNPSFDPVVDRLNGQGACGSGAAREGLKGRPVNGRCGPGMRIPFLVISPYARVNHVSHVLITQASVVRFIEDNWLHGERLGGGSFDASAGSIRELFDFRKETLDPPLFLDQQTGNPVHP